MTLYLLKKYLKETVITVETFGEAVKTTLNWYWVCLVVSLGNLQGEEDAGGLAHKEELASVLWALSRC